MALYIIKFSETIGNLDNTRAKANYYLGFCDDERVDERFKEHCAGRGAAITRYASSVCDCLELIMVLPGYNRRAERLLKDKVKNNRIVLERYLTGTLCEYLNKHRQLWQ